MRYAVLLCGSLWWAPGAFAARAPLGQAPVPAWVVSVPAPAAPAASAGQATGGVQYLLSDTQVRVDGGDRVTYRHMVSKALDTNGVESIANLEFGFDPTYQTLTLHTIDVHRGDRTISKLRTAHVRILQRETDMEQLVFDGRRTASVVLDDVRAGDVVEYAYSLRGTNPVFGGRQFGGFDMQWSVPVARVHARLLWPRQRTLHLRPSNGAPAPTVHDDSTHRDHRWDTVAVAGLKVESNAPGWHDPYRHVQWSEFGDWAAVVDWALPLYRLPATPGPKVRAEIDRIAASHAEPAERLLAALRFVQREVRYLGVEAGVGSHAPNAPEVVLGRRFGDCKDKTQLTLALLRGLGIEASPALVNTSNGRGIERRQASPGAFNHVLVQARLDGKTYWLDPTRALQQGDLAHVVQSDHGVALVVAPGSQGLVPMAGDAAKLQQRDTRAVIDSRAGYDQPVLFTVTTVASGATAERIRGALQADGRESLQQEYVNYYARFYRGIERTAPLGVDDNPAANRITVTEHYRIKDFWQPSGAGQRVEAAVESPEVFDMLRRPNDLVRQSPLGLSHPTALTNVTEVMLPGSPQGKDGRVAVDDPAFRFERLKEWQGATVRLTDRYTSLADHVAAGDVGRYADNLQKAREGMNYSLFHDPADRAAAAAPAAPAPAADPRPVAGEPHWLPAVAITLALMGCAVGAWRLFGWDPAPGVRADRAGAARGLGGWLILLPIGLLGAIVHVVKAMWETWPAATLPRWHEITVAGSPDYHPLWAAVVTGSLVLNIVSLSGAVLVLVLYFGKRSSLPRVFTGFAVLGIAVAITDHVVASAIPAAAAQLPAGAVATLVRQVIVSMLWIAYFARSTRVANTFVQRRQPAPPADVGDTMPMPARV
ncbi:hypothetical protein ASC87_22975 [Rhizobacter sp. Root1221]|nr:hypothetical protein ASC87_22975 [Rhizobacter sp. Root1221]